MIDIIQSYKGRLVEADWQSLKMLEDITPQGMKLTKLSLLPSSLPRLEALLVSSTAIVIKIMNLGWKQKQVLT